MQTALTNNYLRKTSGNILNADINASAAIAYSKLNLAGLVTSADITNGTIVEADIAAGTLTNTSVNATAAIAGSKLAAGTVTGTQISTSAALAGSPTTTTQAVDTNTTAIATTGYVVAQAGAATPNTDSVTAAVVGTSLRYSRADHTHRFHQGIYDSAGTASRLNPMSVGSYVETAGGTNIGDAATYRATGSGWIDVSTALWQNMSMPYDYDGWNAMGGTVQWRVQWHFNLSVATGSSARSATFQYVNIAAGGSAGSATTVTNLSGVSFTDTLGIKAFDSGYVTAPAGLTGSMVFNMITNRTGGVVGTFSRSGILVTVRNI